ncbi:MAG TPA: ATP-dependent DNA helicase [Candidatus Acidoferrum sp.]
MATLFDMGLPATMARPELNVNEAQRRAIAHGPGPLLVIAGAGTGKTRVITERIRHLLETDPGLSGENILALTFTKKAAGEMKARVVRAVGERGKKVTLATFHAFCEALLVDVDPERIILDKCDHWILLRRNLARLKLDRYRRLAEPGQFLNDFIDFFSRCQDELVSCEDFQRYADGLAARLEAERADLDEDTYRERADHVALQQEIARAYSASEELLRERKRVTFGSLITEAVELLKKDDALRETLQQRYRYILVDEFQDTNIAQIELLNLLCAEPRNIFVVGDNDQAIYRFRGASFASFSIFEKKFAGLRDDDDPSRYRVTLTENYRSTPNILRVATHVIAQNARSDRFPPKSLTTSHPEGEKIRIAELANADDESRWITGELERLHCAGHRWKDFAVLYRQHAHRDELVRDLSHAKIPFVISRLSILEHPLVRDVLAYLRLAATPYDDVACARVLAAPAWNLEPRDLVRLTERAAKKRGATLIDVLQAPQTELAFDSSQASLQVLLGFLSEQRKTMRRRSARRILSDVAEWLEIHERAAVQDRKYVTRLAEFMVEWEPKSDTRGLPEYLEYLDYFEQAGGTVGLEDDVPGDAVQLMTVHGAKGLEFEHVFLIRVNNKQFPAGERSRVFEFPAELMKEGSPAEQFHIQEERRLFYVALTRARERLTITTLADKKTKIPTFIEDMVMDPVVKRRNVVQLAPKLPPRQAANAGPDTAAQSLFPAPSDPPRIFSRIADWAETFHPPSPEPLTLSPSALDNYRRCPQQYLFGRLWSLKEGPRGTMTFGRVVHDTIRRALAELRKGNKLPFEEVQRIFETEWKSAGFEDAYQEDEYKKDGVEQLRVFHNAMLDSFPEILEQEKTFELPMENNVIIAGRIDQVNALGRNDVEIVDYKTGKPKKDWDARRDLQLSIYAIAAREIFEWNPVRLVFHYLQNNQVQATTRDAKQLDEAQKLIQEAAADIRAGQFPPKPGYLCRNCAYQPICPSHEENLGS